MHTWVVISVAAAFLQNLRSTTQKQLTTHLSTVGASAARFVFGLPFAVLYLLTLQLLTGAELPTINTPFMVFVLAGGVAQVLATAMLLACFTHGGFATGTTYSKTEGIQAVVFGFVLLGDRVSLGGFVGITASMLGMILVSLSPASTGQLSPVNRKRTTGLVLGLASGALFAVSGVCYRGAALELRDGHFTLRAAFTLVAALAIQCVLLAAYLRITQRGELSRVFTHWRRGVIAGASGAAASAGWFTAFTLASAAYVKAVGSIELLFAVLSSWLIFREQPSRREIAGIALVMIGIVLTVLAT